MTRLLSITIRLVLTFLIISVGAAVPFVTAQESTEADTTEAATAGDQSFFIPSSWLQELTRQQGWGPEYPRMLADVNGDGKQDIVGFGRDGVWLATSNGWSFSPAFVLADFGYESGWRVAKHTRLTGDVNGDRRADLVGFGDAGVYRALSTGTGFGTVNFVLADFGYNQGWRVDKHVRLLADVNGDGRKDIVAFGDAGVWLSLATPDGSFTPPAFVLADFGYNQGWRLDKHIRTTADINGDGRQDIVAFGDAGVWIALSTGTGFGPAQFVLADFGYSAGSWRVDRHVRVLADIDHDGKQDIVGFGDAGVYTARSTGSGFEAAHFVLADFGYNQGWRIGTNPRFVADLNGDGYPDLVGFGNDSVYRSLGSADGFAPMRAMLRAFVVEQGYPWNTSPTYVSDYFPRLVGDVNGDGTQDLVAFDASDVKVAWSSKAPPPPPPAAPANPRVTSATTSSLSIAWNDNSNNERQFLISYHKYGSSQSTETRVGANTTSTVLGRLDADTLYCFTVQAENVFGLSAKSFTACDRTRPQPTPTPSPSRTPTPPPSTSITTSIWLGRQPVIQGFIPYAGSFGPINTGAVITNINFPTQFPPVLLVKPGHSTTECGDPNATVRVHGDMSAAQKQAIWGTATPSITGLQALNFVGCSLSSGPILDILPVNITWHRP